MRFHSSATGSLVKMENVWRMLITTPVFVPTYTMAHTVKTT